jgi:acyl-CoA synthetase (AMP-forming)/AMP-acid ligase II
MTPFFNLGDIIRRDLNQQKIGLIDLGGEDGPREYSYSEIDEKSNAVARGLLQRGLKPNQRVAILSANRAEYIFSVILELCVPEWYLFRSILSFLQP